MLCDVCKKRMATTYYKQIINDNVTELHLCSECASKQGYSNIFGDFYSPLEKMLGSVFSPPKATPAVTKRCATCGSGFDDIIRSGRVGCTDCYTEFHDRIMPSVLKIHGNTCHVGKKPSDGKTALRVKPQAEILREQMNEAVAAQNFELAARLRDEIKALEEEKNEQL